ncbi:hypothetical protein [Streptomyces sp. NPDC050534]|uniref:hypothetical protein n=1 Tax=Streptomyces sp. NPDC050534 TaxID=3365625 RepID=UPI0037BDD8CD
MLATQLLRLRALGYQVKAGVEAEFVLYTDGPSGREPAWSTNLDYALQHPPAVSDLFQALGEALGDAGIVHEAFKTEGAPGQREVTFAYGDALAGCDDYAVLKHLTITSQAGHLPQEAAHVSQAATHPANRASGRPAGGSIDRTSSNTAGEVRRLARRCLSLIGCQAEDREAARWSYCAARKEEAQVRSRPGRPPVPIWQT